jgi:hypothetical protein
MSYELLEKFTDFKIPENVLAQIKNDLITMPKNMLKTMLFASENSLINENIDYWMSIKPKRQLGENFVDYKTRQKFQSALTKYRPYIYDYSENVKIL